MKTLIWLALGCCALQANAALAARCSNATLNGTVVGAGTKFSPSGPGSGLFMESYDGKGSMQYFEMDSTGYQTYTYIGTAVYSVSPDCIASVLYDGATSKPWLYYVDPDGKGYSFVNNRNNGSVSAGHTELISHSLLVDSAPDSPGPCSLATLKGAMGFAYEKLKQGVPQSSDGVETYDGAGHLTYRQTDSTGYGTVSYSGSGVYTITDRCIASVLYDGATTSPWIYIAAPDGSALWWVNNRNVGVVAAGKEWRISGDR